jgi:hypothetical protein
MFQYNIKILKDTPFDKALNTFNYYNMNKDE